MNADTPVDVDAYLRRIHFSGAVAPTVPTLASLLRAHARWIPFENLDVLLRRPIRLDVQSLQQKLVSSRRGGYCFEHATLVAAVLEAIGFAPLRHTARVVLYTSREQAPRTHMFLTVDVDGDSFVVDPGFGGLAPTSPVPLTAQHDVADRASHWMARDGNYWMLRTRSEGTTVDCWVSTLDVDNRVDFDVGNHYTATHPASPFVNRLMLRTETDDGSILVMNRNVKAVRADGVAETTLADRAALRTLLDAHFGFDLPEVLSLRVPAIEEWR
jgi:N-hydroxyarylamine O-acetyltransferase